MATGDCWEEGCATAGLAGDEGSAGEPPVAVSKASSAPANEKRDRGSLSTPAVDYLRCYRLQRGLFRQSVLAITLGLAGAGSLLALVRQGHWQMFSPGALAGPHQAVIEGNCTNCHSGWQRVSDPACAECHEDAGSHQITQVQAPACVDCHSEHRGGAALELSDEGSCVACHGALDAQVLASTRFAARITDFAPGDHPELAVGDGHGTPRRRLTPPVSSLADAESWQPPVDPGSLRDFSHAWHLGLATRRLACDDCHQLDVEDEISPLRFEASCQGCHNLPLDSRFGGQQAPHDEPLEVLTHLSGRYALRPEILRQLNGAERRRLQGRRLTPERQLHELARLHTERLLRHKCVKCHTLSAPGVKTTIDVGQSPIESLEVHPVQLPHRWLPHARFRHQPHLHLMTCQECHSNAEASESASDVLLPGIAVCFECHRSPRPGEQQLARLGRTTCVACHGYHPESEESTSRVMVATRSRPTRGG